jgi:hypothetical protein
LFYFLFICQTHIRTFFNNLNFFNFWKYLVDWNLWFGIVLFWRTLFGRSFAWMGLILYSRRFFVIFYSFLGVLLGILLFISFSLFFSFFYGIRPTLYRIYFFHWFLFYFFVFYLIIYHDNIACNVLIRDLKSCFLEKLNFDIV